MDNYDYEPYYNKYTKLYMRGNFILNIIKVLILIILFMVFIYSYYKVYPLISHLSKKGEILMDNIKKEMDYIHQIIYEQNNRINKLEDEIDIRKFNNNIDKIKDDLDKFLKKLKI